MNSGAKLWGAHGGEKKIWIGLNVCRASQVVLVVKNPPANAGDARDLGLILESGRSP